MDEFPGSIGVSKEPGGRWEAYLYASRRKIFLGNFDAKHDAASAHDYAALNYHSHEKVATNLVPGVAYSTEIKFVKSLEFGILAAILRVCAKLLRYPKSSGDTTSAVRPPASSNSGSTWGMNSGDEGCDDVDNVGISQQTLRAIMKASAEFALKEQFLTKPAPLSALARSELSGDLSSSGRSSRCGTPTSGCSACSTSNANHARAGNMKAGGAPSRRQLLCGTCGDPGPGVGPFLKALQSNNTIAPAAVMSLLGSQVRGRGRSSKEDGIALKDACADSDECRVSDDSVAMACEPVSSTGTNFHGRKESRRGQKRSYLSMKGASKCAIAPVVGSPINSASPVQLRQDECPVDSNTTALPSSHPPGYDGGGSSEGKSPMQKACSKLQLPMCSLVRRSPARRGLRASFCLTLTVPVWRNGQKISSAAMALPVTDGESVLSCLFREQAACLPLQTGERERSAAGGVLCPCPQDSNVGVDVGTDSDSPTAGSSRAGSFRRWQPSSDTDTPASAISASIQVCLQRKGCNFVPYKRMGSAFSAWIPRMKQDRLVVEASGVMPACLNLPSDAGFDLSFLRTTQQETH